MRVESDRPDETGLKVAYPNPFQEGATIPFVMASAGPARLQIFDASGRLIRTLLDEDQPPGEQLVDWDGNDWRGAPVGQGLYLARLEVGGRSWSRHLLKAD
jgi:hypothetical protein